MNIQQDYIEVEEKKPTLLEAMAMERVAGIDNQMRGISRTKQKAMRRTKSRKERAEWFLR